MDAYEVTAVSAAPPSAVWSVLLNASTWPTWSVVDALDVDRSENLAASGEDGVGAIRAFRTHGLLTRERITALVLERRFAYEIIASPFFRHYEGVVELEQPAGRHTRIAWRGRYRARLGRRWLMRSTLPGAQQQMVDGLARYAEECPPSPSTAMTC